MRPTPQSHIYFTTNQYHSYPLDTPRVPYRSYQSNFNCLPWLFSHTYGYHWNRTRSALLWYSVGPKTWIYRYPHSIRLPSKTRWCVQLWSMCAYHYHHIPIWPKSMWFSLANTKLPYGCNSHAQYHYSHSSHWLLTRSEKNLYPHHLFLVATATTIIHILQNPLHHTHRATIPLPLHTPPPRPP